MDWVFSSYLVFHNATKKKVEIENEEEIYNV
jgi:hypothetical protein